MSWKNSKKILLKRRIKRLSKQNKKEKGRGKNNCLVRRS